MRHVSLLLTSALIAGLAGGVIFGAPSVLGVTLTMSAAWTAFALARARRDSHLQLAAGCALVIVSGWMFGAHAVDRALNSPLRILLEQRLGGFALGAPDHRTDEPIMIEGRLLADAVATANGAVIRLSITHVRLHSVAERTSGGVSLGVSGEMFAPEIAEWTAGRIVRAPVLLRRPARYLNHGLADQERVLARRGISLVGSIKSAALVEVVARGQWWEETAAWVRARTRAALARHVAPRDAQASAVATAILIGDRAGLSVETEHRLQEAGTYHVIAISGGNIAILVTLLLGVMALAGVHGRVAAAIVIVALTAYGVIASGGPSVLRATVMAVIYLAVRLIDQRTAPVNAISLTASAVLLFNPLQIMDVGFWFTFGATVALVTAAQLWPQSLPRVWHTKDARAVWVRWFAGAVAVLVGTVCVELALAPIAAYVFQRVTLAGLPLNFVALPAMTVVQLGAMSVIVADVLGLGSVASVLGAGVHLASVALIDSARLLDYAPWLTWRVPTPQPALMVAYYVFAALTIVSWRLRFSRSPSPAGWGIAALALFVWIVTAPGARVRSLGDGRLHISMLDVGQGDCILVTFPNGRHGVIDTGGLQRGEFDIGERVIGPTLRARGLLSLDYLVVTHGDADHVGGARSLVRDFGPQEMWWGIPVARHEPTERVKEEAVRQRSAWRTLQLGDRLTVGGVDLHVHHPPPEDWERQRVRNNDSLVVELRFGQVSVLLTGDIEGDVEDRLASTLDLLPFVVLKVPHHGSLTSSTPRFLKAVRPNVALIGVGRGNTYGHPAPHVIGRLHDAGAEVFRTDLDGQIEVVTDGETVWTRTFTGWSRWLEASHGGYDRREGHEGR